jgi:hypothetical protein
MHEILNDENDEKNNIIGIDTKQLINEKELYPNKLNIIIFTNISEDSINYNPKMSYPSTSSPNVYFTPFIKLSESDLLPNIALLSSSTELPKKTFDIFFNEKNFNELLQKKIDQNNGNFLKIKESCDNNVIDNNIKNILNILFKSGNLFYIKDNPYTINNYEWTTGDWFIYSPELDKKSKNIDNDILKRNKNEDNKETKIEKQTKEAFEIISKNTPNCLKGDAATSLIQSENQKKIYAQKLDILKNNKFFNKDNIDEIFNIYKENSSNIFNKNLCFNLNDQIPSFDKDPLTISLLYIGNNFVKDIETYPILKKFYESIDTNAFELNEIINKINNIITDNNLLIIDDNFNNNSFFKEDLNVTNELNSILNSLIKKLENKIKSEQFRKSWYDYLEREIQRIILNYNELTRIFKTIISDKTQIKNINTYLTSQIQNNIINYFEIIKNSIIKINEKIPNPMENMKGFSGTDTQYSFSDIEKKFNELIKNLNNTKNKFLNNLNTISENTNEFYNKFNLTKQKKELPANFINNKIDFFKTCKKVYSLTKQKIISQNNYLNKLFVFYKKLYDLKKKEYEQISSSLSSSSFKNADNIRLQLSIRIILFDVIIYNTLIYDTCYRNVYTLYLKNIDIVIKKLEELETKKFNIKDETKNSIVDENAELINLFKDYYYYIFFINFNLDKIMWNIISKKTLDIKNKFKSFISKSINEYAKHINLYEDTHETIFGEVKKQLVSLYNLDFSNFSEQESMKIICYELINLFSKLNMITLFRSYKTNTINYFVCNNFSKKINYFEKKDIKYTFNQIYFIYDFNNLKLDNPNNTSCISFPNKNCNVFENVCYNDYKSSIELITPSITNEELDKLCNSINKTEEYDEFTNTTIQYDFQEKNKYFGFPLYILFNNLFTNTVITEQFNNLESYISNNICKTIIYGIYNGNNLLKTIIDSITWDLALQNYKFLYNEDCSNIDSTDKNNNDEYKLNIISYFYENYKLNIIIISKTTEYYYKIIKNNNDKINKNYPYIYILNETVKIEKENKTINEETYYNIYTFEELVRNKQIINFIFNQNLNSTTLTTNTCEDNYINNNIIVLFLEREQLLNILNKIFNIFLDIFKEIKNVIKEKDKEKSKIINDKFAHEINKIIKKYNDDLKNYIYQFLYVKLRNITDKNEYTNIKNPSSSGKNIENIDNSNKFFFWVLYFFNIRPFLNRNNNQSIYNNYLTYDNMDLTIDDDIIPYKTYISQIPYIINIPESNGKNKNVEDIPYSLDNLINILDEDKVKLGNNIVKIYQNVDINDDSEIEKPEVDIISESLKEIIKLFDKKFISSISKLLGLDNSSNSNSYTKTAKKILSKKELDDLKKK